MKSEKDKPPSRWPFRKYLVIFLFSLILAVLVDIRLPLRPAHYQIGDIAARNIRSTADYTVPGTDVSVKKGEVIVREGQRIGPRKSGSLPGCPVLSKRGRRSPAICSTSSAYFSRSLPLSTSSPTGTSRSSACPRRISSSRRPLPSLRSCW